MDSQAVTVGQILAVTSDSCDSCRSFLFQQYFPEYDPSWVSCSEHLVTHIQTRVDNWRLSAGVAQPAFYLDLAVI